MSPLERSFLAFAVLLFCAISPATISAGFYSSVERHSGKCRSIITKQLLGMNRSLQIDDLFQSKNIGVF